MPLLVNVLNSIVGIRERKLRPHNGKDYITKLIPVMYDEKSKSKQFKSFPVDTFREQKLIKYVQRLLGYCISGETREQVGIIKTSKMIFFIMYHLGGLFRTLYKI